MSKEQIIALVNAKIAGQGSAVDVGGALPAILNSLAELAGNAVSPDSTDMPASDQMKVRKNLGLYYEETTTDEKEVVSDGNTSTKLSDDVPAKDDILKVINGGGIEADFSIVDTANGYTITSSGITAFTIIEDDGIYPGSMYSVDWKLVYNGETTVVSKIDKKFLPEQEDAGPTIVSDITNLGSNVLSKAKAGDVFVEKNATTGTETAYILSFMPHTEGSFGDDVYDINFVNIDNTNITVVRYNTSGFPNLWNYIGKFVFNFRTVPGPVILDITSKLVPGSNVDVETTYGLSAENMADIYDGKILALRYPVVGDNSSGIYTLLSASKNNESNPYHAVFVGSDGNKYTFTGFDDTPADISISEPDGVKPISITGLPTAAMTTPAQLAAIGLSPSEIYSAAYGERNGIKYRNGTDTYFIPIISAAYESALNKISFKFGTNTYACTVDTTYDTATVTVTPD